jgi:molecular chaperone GrpE
MGEGKGKPDKINLDEILDGTDTPGPPSPEDPVIEVVSEGGETDALLKAALAEKERLNDLYLRARADLENLRRRHERDREEDRARLGGSILREILPALDNLDRALAHTEDAPGFREGVTLIRRQFDEIFRKLGVEPIETLGEPFDPLFHEAVTAEPREGFAPNTIIEEIAKGYTYAGRVLRPSLVKVAIAPPAAAPRSEAGEAGDETKGESGGTDHRD